MPLPDPFLKRIIRFPHVALLVLLGLVPMTACRSKPSNVRLEAKFLEVGEEEKNSLRRLASSASPPGFQTAEFMMQHGLVDMLVERKEMCPTLAKMVRYMAAAKA